MIQRSRLSRWNIRSFAIETRKFTLGLVDNGECRTIAGEDASADFMLDLPVYLAPATSVIRHLESDTRSYCRCNWPAMFLVTANFLVRNATPGCTSEV